MPAVASPVRLPAADPMRLPAADPMRLPAADPMRLPAADPLNQQWWLRHLSPATHTGRQSEFQAPGCGLAQL